MATQSAATTKTSSPAATGAVLGGILGGIAGGGSGVVAGIIVGAIEGLVVVSLVEHFGKPAWAIVMATLKAVLGSMVGAAIAWWILAEMMRNATTN